MSHPGPRHLLCTKKCDHRPTSRHSRAISAWTGRRPPEKRLHSGIAFHTPADVHYGRAAAVQAQRATVLDGAYAAHPERFVRKPPTPLALPDAAWINKPNEDQPDSTNS